MQGVEWARLDAERILVARPDRAWVHRVVGPGDPFAAPMPEGTPGSLETTRRLLDGAVGAGVRRARALGGPEVPPLTPLRWAWRLLGLYTTTSATPPLLAEVEERFEAAGRAVLAAWACEKGRDETGHERLALKDLRALGYRPEIVAVRPEPAASLVRYFTAQVRDEVDPVGALGYAHGLERLALLRDRAYVERVRAILPAGVDATRCLRVHSGAGSDAGHVEDNIVAAARLSAKERARVAVACYETAVLCCARPPGGVPSELALEELLDPWRVRADFTTQPGQGSLA